MNDEPIQPPFLKFLEAGSARGGFETDDILAAFLPLMKQTHAAHGSGLVAPLNGTADLSQTADGHLMFAPAKAGPPEKNTAKVQELQSPASRAMEIVAESRRKEKSIPYEQYRATRLKRTRPRG